jgi:MFS family permease
LAAVFARDRRRPSVEQMTEYFSLLGRRPAFRRLWAAELVSLIGDWFSVVAVSIVSFASPGGGVLALATALAAHLLPQSFAAPFGGWLADRFDKRRVLMLGSVLEAALTIGMTLAAARGEIVLMQALLALRSIASSAREPATGSILPRLVEPDELARANALMAFTWSVSFALGMSLGGLATALGAEVALAIDAGTFVLAALLMRKLPSVRATAVGGAIAVARVFGDIVDAARAAARPALRRTVFAQAPIALVSGSAWLCLNLAGSALPIAFGAATTVGILQAIRGVGTGVGPILLSSDFVSRRPRLARIVGDRAADIAAGLVAFGALLVAWAPSSTIVAFGCFMWGAGGGALWVIIMTEIQERAPEATRGRMIAFSGLAFTITMSLGALMTAVAVDAGVAALAASAPAAVVSVMGWVLVRHPARAAVAA